jgi:hypothetical protein
MPNVVISKTQKMLLGTFEINQTVTIYTSRTLRATSKSAMLGKILTKCLLPLYKKVFLLTASVSIYGCVLL